MLADAKYMALMKRCCEEGRPLQLEAALRDLRAVKLLDRSALRDWMDVAQAKGHMDCVEVLKDVLLADAK